ncbi:MAG TPA: type II CAAX endopeptidase family protein [Acidimicrobiales bacterium]|nr:type II CAAX endopeptidase family protein [Acidimicrobiales bacterium]
MTRWTAAQGRQGIAAALFGFAVGLVVSQVTAYIAIAATGYQTSSNAPLPVAVLVAELAGLWVGLVAAVLWWSRTRGTGSVVRDYGWAIKWWDVPLGVLVGWAGQEALVPLLYRPFEHIDHNIVRQLGQPTVHEVGAAHTNLSVALLYLFVAVGAPIVEELYFRGLLLRALAGWTNPVAAVIVSGLLFGLAHFEKLQFAGLAAIGIIFGVLAWRTGRLAPSIAAHVTFNAVAVHATVHFH